jgi:hypothetical protein
MKHRSEQEIFKEILSYTPEHLRTIFRFREEGDAYFFDEVGHPGHYVSVQKNREKDFFVPVNADFDFTRPAGSNNYSELRVAGLYLVHAFGLTVDWE